MLAAGTDAMLTVCCGLGVYGVAEEAVRAVYQAMRQVKARTFGWSEQTGGAPLGVLSLREQLKALTERERIMLALPVTIIRAAPP